MKENIRYFVRYGMLDKDFYILDKDMLVNYFKDFNKKTVVYYRPHVEKVLYYNTTKEKQKGVKMKECFCKSCKMCGDLPDNCRYKQTFWDFINNIVKRWLK